MRRNRCSSVLEPVLSGEADLAVAVPPRGRISGSACGRSAPPWGWRAGWSWAPRTCSPDYSWSAGRCGTRGGRSLVASGPSLVLELLLRRPSRCVDVPVPVGPEFRPQRFQFQDLRPLKHVLDGRYGSLSRLIQFCFVGASGMVVNLTFYALFQWLLSFTPLNSATSPRFGFSWNLAIAARHIHRDRLAVELHAESPPDVQRRAGRFVVPPVLDLCAEQCRGDRAELHRRG